MKKLCSLLMATFVLGSAAVAQVTLKPHVGVNLTDLKIDAAGSSASGKAGALAGLSVQFGKKLYFEPGLQYVGKSSSYTSTTPSIPPDVNLNIRGIRMPLAVGINLLGNQKSALTFHGFGGLSGFFIMSNNFSDIGADIKNTQWGVFAGAGIDIWKLFFDVSYEWSLSKLAPDANVGGTRSLYLNAGIRMNFGSGKKDVKVN